MRSPSTDGFAAKRLCQSPQLRMATSVPGRSSSAANVRPSDGKTPSVWKRSGRNLGAGNPFWRAIARDFKRDVSIGSDGFEGLLVASKIVEIKRGERHASDARLWEPFLERHQAVCVGVAERPNQHGIYDGEEGRVRADPEAEGKDDDRGETSAAAKRPGRVTQVPNQAGHARGDPPGVAQLFTDLRDAAELPPGDGACVAATGSDGVCPPASRGETRPRPAGPVRTGGGGVVRGHAGAG